MPWAPKHPCPWPGCGRATDKRYCPEHSRTHERERMVSEPWRRWYLTVRWFKLKSQVLAAARYLCQCPTCKAEGRATPTEHRTVRGMSKGVVHHRVPHRGDPALFWDIENCIAVAKRCHDRLTAAEVHGRRAHS